MKKILVLTCSLLFTSALFAQEFTPADKDAKNVIPEIAASAVNIEETDFDFDLGIGKNAKLLEPVIIGYPSKQQGSYKPVLTFTNTDYLNKYLSAGPKLPGTNFAMGVAFARDCNECKTTDISYLTFFDGTSLYSVNAYDVANYLIVKSGNKDIVMGGSKYNVKLDVSSIKNPLSDSNKVVVKKEKGAEHKISVGEALKQINKSAHSVDINGKRYYVYYTTSFNRVNKALRFDASKKLLILLESADPDNMYFLPCDGMDGKLVSFVSLKNYAFSQAGGKTIIYKFGK